MKQSFIGVILLLSVLLLCCDESTSHGGMVNSGLEGSWLWKQSTGGIGGTTTIPAAGNVHVLRITSDSTFVETKNDTILFTDTFTTHLNSAGDSTKKQLVIDFLNSKRFSLLVEIVTNDSLILSDMIVDGYSSFYTRIR
ncbi:MAG: hypothetical protein WCW40_02420 [Bacteroidota bacterium]